MLATSDSPQDARDFQRSADLPAKMGGAILPVDHCILRWNAVDKLQGAALMVQASDKLPASILFAQAPYP